MNENELFGNSEQLESGHEKDHVADPGKMVCGLISRQAAIDSLNEYFSRIGKVKRRGLSNAEKAISLDTVGAIKALPPAQPGWIPWDSGKLPKESGYYTVTAYDGTTKRVTHAKYQKRLKRWELTGARAYWRVLAWLPPIEPWEGEKDG